MKCYNHPDRDAVVACSSCGKGLCRECADRWDPPLCDSCARTHIQEQRAQAKKTVGLSIAIFGVLFLLGSVSGIIEAITHGAVLQIPGGILYSVVFAYMIAGIPCGWSALTNVTPRIFLFLPIIWMGNLLFV